MRNSAISGIGVMKAVVAILGHPNVGKTTLFNQITGSSAAVGNWSGVTLKSKEAQDTWHGQGFDWIDLPGIYTLTQHEGSSYDAVHTLNWLYENPSAKIINVLAVEELSQQLFLTLQLLERGYHPLLVLNFKSAAQQKSWENCAQKLGLQLGIRVLALHLGEISLAVMRESVYGTLEALEGHDAIAHIHALHLPMDYQKWIDSSMRRLALAGLGNKNFLLGALEGDQIAAEALRQQGIQIPFFGASSSEVNAPHGIDPDPPLVIASVRYQRCQSLSEAVGLSENDVYLTKTDAVSEKLDEIFLSPRWSVPLFGFSVGILFFFSFSVGAAFAPLTRAVMRCCFLKPIFLLPQMVMERKVIALLIRALSFSIDLLAEMLPQLAFLFSGMSLLESTGYLARIAFLMDRLMQTVGLSGKVCLPMLLGFGCSVPGIEAAQALDTTQDRLQASLMIPLLPCGARLLIFSAFIKLFFKNFPSLVLLSLYAIGIAAGLVTAKWLQKLLGFPSNDRLTFVIPRWQRPRCGYLVKETARRIVQFALGAGSVIFISSFLVSFAFDWGVQDQIGLTGWIVASSKYLTKALAPIGVGENNWPAAAALIAGLWAKEILLSTLGTLVQVQKNLSLQYPITQENLPIWSENTVSFSGIGIELWEGITATGQALKSCFLGQIEASSPSVLVQDNRVIQKLDFSSGFESSWGVYCYLIFVLLYNPCLTTVSAIYKNLGIRWALFSVCWSIYLAYSVSWFVFKLQFLKVGLWGTCLPLFLGVVFNVGLYSDVALRWWRYLLRIPQPPRV